MANFSYLFQFRHSGCSSPQESNHPLGYVHQDRWIPSWQLSDPTNSVPFHQTQLDFFSSLLLIKSLNGQIEQVI